MTQGVLFETYNLMAVRQIKKQVNLNRIFQDLVGDIFDSVCVLKGVETVAERFALLVSVSRFIWKREVLVQQKGVKNEEVMDKLFISKQFNLLRCFFDDEASISEGAACTTQCPDDMEYVGQTEVNSHSEIGDFLDGQNGSIVLFEGLGTYTSVGELEVEN